MMDLCISAENLRVEPSFSKPLEQAFEKTEWKNARPGGARHLVLCDNLSRASRLPAFVKFL
jgi:hypothetical protein